MIGPWRTSIATVCLGGTLEDKLAACADAGFDGIELFENDLVTSQLTPAEISARVRSLGMTIDLYQPFRDFEGVDDARLEANLARAAAKFALMRTLGADTMLVCSNVATATIDDDLVLAAQLGRLAELAAESGIRIAYEALAWGRHVSTLDRAWRIVERADHPALGLCVDSFHILSRWTDPAVMARIPPSKLLFCQLADAPRMDLDVLSWSRHHRCFPGEGAFDLARFTRILLDAGYTGPMSLEVFNDVFRAADAHDTADEAMRSLVLLADATESAALPQTRVGGLDYVEITAPPGSRVGGLLTALGLTNRGTHRRKPVSLFTAGDIRIVLVSGGDAARISGLGVVVDDAEAASARAAAVLVPPEPRDTAPDEVPIRLVRTPNGIDLGFTTGVDGSSGWPAEFTGNPPAGSLPPGRPGLLTRVDHVALAEPADRVEAALLIYGSLLGLAASAPADISDPTGLVRSQSLRTPDDRLRLAVNVLPTGALSAGSQHLALESHDLLATVRGLRDAGFTPLAVPANYYADLASRLPVPDALLHQLAAHDAFYDRDESGGEFLQAYTPIVGDLFIEIVERRGGYAGFGAPNAPARRAAQYRSHLVASGS